jgi:hypothetical protein
MKRMTFLNQRALRVLTLRNLSQTSGRKFSAHLAMTLNPDHFSLNSPPEYFLTEA